MELKEFLKPEWKKFALPLALLVLFFFLENAYGAFGSAEDNVYCPASQFMKNMEVAKSQNDTVGMQKIIDNARPLQKDFTEFMQNAEKIKSNTIVDGALRMADPFLPSPCELSIRRPCIFYMNETSYNCIREAASVTSNVPEFALGLVGGFGDSDNNLPSYKTLSYNDVIFNALFLATEGYLISCLIFLAYTKLRKQS